MSDITVFISYSHDSAAHRKRVLSLSERLRADGIATLLDQYVNGSPVQGWPRWMLDQLDAAVYVLVVCSETYYRRFRGHEAPAKGKGVDWEGALITQELYDSRSRTLKFVPIFLGTANSAHIPEPLRAVNYYALTSEDAYQRLHDFLLGYAGVKPGPIGTLPPQARKRGTALRFDDPAAPTSTLQASTLAQSNPVRADLRCCLLISEALDKACQAATGGGSSTRLHRLLDVAQRWLADGHALLTEWRPIFDADLAHRLSQLCTDTLPLLIAEARRELPAPGDGDADRGDNPIFKDVRYQARGLQDQLTSALNTNPAFKALAGSAQRWPILGFSEEAAFNDFLLPPIENLARNPSPMQRDLFDRLLAQPEFSPRQLHAEGYPRGLVMDTVNALMLTEWAKWTDLRELGSAAKGSLTPVGQRLLKQRLAVGGASPAAPASAVASESVKIWQAKLAFLLREEAIASDSSQKFKLQHDIAEARAKLRELEADE